jgi:hypothetical protein
MKEERRLKHLVCSPPNPYSRPKLGRRVFSAYSRVITCSVLACVDPKCRFAQFLLSACKNYVPAIIAFTHNRRQQRAVVGCQRLYAGSVDLSL